MSESLRLTVGVLCNGSSLLLYASPILTFVRVIKKRSTGEFSSIPYVVALVSCLTWTWYGLPIVSHDWENFPVVTIGILGSHLEFSFVVIYFWFATSKAKIEVASTAVPLLLVFGATVGISAFGQHDRHERKVFVGVVGIVVSVAMYAAPLVAIKQVIRSKSVEFMPFHLSFSSLLASSFWLAYGLLNHDLFVAAPSFVGCPLAILQLALYFTYRNRGIISEDPKEYDLERFPEKVKQTELPVNSNCNCNVDMA